MRLDVTVFQFSGIFNNAIQSGIQFVNIRELIDFEVQQFFFSLHLLIYVNYRRFVLFPN